MKLPASRSLVHADADPPLCGPRDPARASSAFVPDAVLRLSRAGRILAVQTFPGFPHPLPLAGLVGRELRDVLSPDAADALQAAAGRALATGRTQGCELPAFDLGGAARECDALLTADRPDEVLVLLRDVAERRRLERQVLQISEDEQRRIGQDLHDGLGQQLTAIAFMAKALERKMNSGAGASPGDAAEIVQQVNRTIAETRELARGLCPLNLDASGLRAALEVLAAGTQARFGLECVIEMDPSAEVREGTVSAQLFRIAQEAVRNAVKHGSGRTVRIRLTRENGATLLTVHDDGIGIPGPSDLRPGLGLHLMSSRAKLIGASLEIARATEGGTRVACRLPETKSGA